MRLERAQPQRPVFAKAIQLLEGERGQIWGVKGVGNQEL